MSPSTLATYLANRVTETVANTLPLLDLDEPWTTGIRTKVGYVVEALDRAVREIFPAARLGWIRHTKQRYMICVDDGASSWTSQVQLHEGLMTFEDGQVVWWVPTMYPAASYGRLAPWLHKDWPSSGDHYGRTAVRQIEYLQPSPYRARTTTGRPAMAARV